jgi:glycerol dehydrogenase-like iron-containing ADH family enzyme
MLSTDVFATNKSAIVFVGKKVTVESVLPQLVIVDDRYLARSENENRHGVADILSIHTALMDWNLAEKAAAAKIDQPTYDRAQRVLNSMLEIPASQVNNRLSDVLMLVAEAGYITNDYGSGRPESGSEHIFASALELKMSMLHGAAVSLGIMIMTRVYDTVDRRVENYLCNLGMVEAINELKIPRALVTEVLQTLEPRQGRYTIVNRKLQWQEHIGVILDDLPVTFA